MDGPADESRGQSSRASDIAGLEWWTSTLADEETVRFVGKLYRHYAIEGQTNFLTTDPLFLTHIQNADFEKGTNGWTLHPAVEGSIAPKSFPRYGRIEGRYMGLGRPPDPEHIGDLDSNRGFTEMYSSNPEPKIPVWITYHWKVFRAKGTTAELTVSDWPADHEPNPTFGQEQAFNFLEIQPYRE